MRDQPDWTWVGALVALMVAGIATGTAIAVFLGL